MIRFCFFFRFFPIFFFLCRCPKFSISIFQKNYFNVFQVNKHNIKHTHTLQCIIIYTLLYIIYTCVHFVWFRFDVSFGLPVCVHFVRVCESRGKKKTKQPNSPVLNLEGSSLNWTTIRCHHIHIRCRLFFSINFLVFKSRAGPRPILCAEAC
jgi:hypothetical protein